MWYRRFEVDISVIRGAKWEKHQLLLAVRDCWFTRQSFVVISEPGSRPR
jgi:hypothetical protein